MVLLALYGALSGDLKCVCVCVGGNRTQVSSFRASANISSPPVIADVSGRMDDSTAVETDEWLRYLPHYSYSCLNFRSVSRKYRGESKGFMSITL